MNKTGSDKAISTLRGIKAPPPPPRINPSPNKIKSWIRHYPSFTSTYELGETVLIRAVVLNNSLWLTLVGPSEFGLRLSKHHHSFRNTDLFPCCCVRCHKTNMSGGGCRMMWINVALLLSMAEYSSQKVVIRIPKTVGIWVSWCWPKQL